MIHEAKAEDLKNLSRRGFLRMFGGTAASAVVAPTKTFVFFGDILRPRSTPIIPSFPQDILVGNSPWFMGVAGIIGIIPFLMGKSPEQIDALLKA